MATKKKATPKKTVKTVKAVKTVKKSSPKKKNEEYKTFAIQPEKHPFMSFHVSDQTIYWAILLLYIMGLSLWVLNIQIDTCRILENVTLN